MATVKYTSKLAGSTVLIIGGTSGLGFALAEALVEHKASHVYLVSSRSSKVSSSIARLKSTYPDSQTTVLGITCNLGDEANLEPNIQSLFQQVDRKLDHIVYTAGDAIIPRPLGDVTMANMLKSGMVRFFAPFFVAKHGAAYLNAGPASSITFTGGAASEKPVPGWGATSSYLAGLHGMTRALAFELKPVRVNLINPGVVDTELWDVLGSQEVKDHVLHEMAKNTTTGQVGNPADVVESYLYVLKDKNISGTIVRSDGGLFIV
jgi:NAD(P)-dependent dehydrogenase (short-subunit alcohol dehydrogenase family)